MIINSVSTGNAGEYYVAAALERRGFSVAVPMSDVPTFDLLAIDRDDYSRQIAIQVKTNTTKKDNVWLLGEKDEKRTEKNFFYIFVKFVGNDEPTYHIVPSEEVSKSIKEYHTEWLNTPSKGGKMHKDSQMRQFFDLENKYKDRWDLLK